MKRKKESEMTIDEKIAAVEQRLDFYKDFTTGRGELYDGLVLRTKKDLKQELRQLKIMKLNEIQIGNN